jgi:ribosomal protein L37AE/L43A
VQQTRTKFSSQFRFYPCSSPKLPMHPASTTTAAARRQIGSRHRTSAPRRPSPPPYPSPKRMKLLTEVMEKAAYAVVEREDYGDISCEQCRSGERAEELLLCDKCDKGYHMKCLRPIVVRVPIGSWICNKCSGDGQGRVRSRGVLFYLF